MFTGIITDVGRIESVEQRGDLRARITTAYDTGTVDLGASIACSGVCLTVIDRGPGWFAVDISGETIARSVPDRWQAGRPLNLERALKVGDELGGHIVTGHADGIAMVEAVEPVGDSLRITLCVGRDVGPYIAQKGSVTLDGVSLTVNSVADTSDSTVFTVNIIPHTAAHTSLGTLQAGSAVNVEIDVLARYLKRMNEMAM